MLESQLRKNVVIFGESGVGKSSIISMIAGRSVARQTFPRGSRCPFEFEKYQFVINGGGYHIWDTAGLDDDFDGPAFPDRVNANLNNFERELVKAGRIDLLLHCVRGARFRSAWLKNHQIFHSTIFRRQVPIAVIVTGLENHEEEMEHWWRVNGRELLRQMHIDAHACITTLDPNTIDSPVLKLRCVESRETVISLITKTYCHPSRNWTAQQNAWFAAAFQDLRVVMSPPSRKRGRLPPAPNVVLYDPAHTSNAHDEFAGRLMVIGGSLLNVYRIAKHLGSGRRCRKHVSLVIFVPSICADAQVSRQQCVSFLQSYGGQTRPLLVVVKGAETDEEAQRWWNTGAYHYTEVRAVVAALPPPTSALETGQAMKLRQLIQDGLPQATEVGWFRWLFVRRHTSRLRSAGSHPVKDDALTASVVWMPWVNY
ncbi:hypothetical protein F5I97DRAFT_1858070 [Phlebopus sp. FC_14]|nr:hypothetical protein F5I97DRAFT_1858070 [Phlebopus sp. FC_14]